MEKEQLAKEFVEADINNRVTPELIRQMYGEPDYYTNYDNGYHSFIYGNKQIILNKGKMSTIRTNK